MSHLSADNRKTISTMLHKNNRCVEIAFEIGCDTTTVAKEIKNNRILLREAKSGFKNSFCTKLLKRPYVCSFYNIRYTKCPYAQYRYDWNIAQKKYEQRLHDSRKGINLTKDEHENLNSVLKQGIEDKKSIYAIVHEYNLPVSVSTIYRYISEGKVSVKKIDLPYAVSYKKRKSQMKKYDYSDTKIDRSNRTYIDFLAYKRSKINEMTVQMDFLGSIKSDSKSILTLIIPKLHFVFLFIIEKKEFL